VDLHVLCTRGNTNQPRWIFGLLVDLDRLDLDRLEESGSSRDALDPPTARPLVVGNQSLPSRAFHPAAGTPVALRAQHAIRDAV